MSSVDTSQATSAVVILAIFVAILARRTVAMAQGTPYSPARTYGFGLFSAVFFVVFGASTIYIAERLWGPVALVLVAPYAAVVAGIAFAAAPHVQQRVRFETRVGGTVYYRLPVYIPLITVVLFVVRATIEILLLGLASFASFSIPSSLPSASVAVLIGFDLLYGGSVGLLFGRGAGIRRAYAAAFPPDARPLA